MLNELLNNCGLSETIALNLKDNNSPGIYLLKVNNENSKNVSNLSKVNNKDRRTTPITLPWCLYYES